MNSEINELLDALRNLLDLDIDLNKEENKQHILAIIERIENENNEEY